MAERLYPSADRQLRRDKRYMKQQLRRFAVQYDLAYDGGGSTWTGYYRTCVGARIAAFVNVFIRSWGGTADLTDQWKYARLED